MSKINIKIQGKGDSLWGESDGIYYLTEYDTDTFDEEVFPFTLTIYGRNLHWYQYTDSQIEKEVENSLKPILEKEFGGKLKYLCWSEQGMQPEDGWNFDIGWKD